MMLILQPSSGLRWHHRMPMSSLGAAVEGLRGWQVPSSVAWAGSGGLWDLAGDDALTRFGGWTERNSLFKQREEARGEEMPQKSHCFWCDAFPVELEVGGFVSRCPELCARGCCGFLHPKQPLCRAGRDAELLCGVQEHPVHLPAA